MSICRNSPGPLQQNIGETLPIKIGRYCYYANIDKFLKKI